MSTIKHGADEHAATSLTYTPRHPDGRSGPRFEFAVQACWWILHQDQPGEWTWEGGV